MDRRNVRDRGGEQQRPLKETVRLEKRRARREAESTQDREKAGAVTMSFSMFYLQVSWQSLLY